MTRFDQRSIRRRLNRDVDRPVLGNVVEGVPEPLGESRQVRGAQGGRFRHGRPMHGDPELVSLKLQNEIARCATIGSQRLEREATSVRHRINNVAGLQCN